MTNGPRIIAGAWRGRRLAAPPGLQTRPTAARARQAVFDILMHSPWAGGEFLRAAHVLDVFAGTGAYGLEALSRGAPRAGFIENAQAALVCLRANIAACRAEAVTNVFPHDATTLPPGRAHDLIFLDPPYGGGLVTKALASLGAKGWIATEAVIVTEVGPNDAVAIATPLAERAHGQARLVFWRYQP